MTSERIPTAFEDGFYVSRLRAESFRQFKRFDQEWGAFNVLVGANGSGKSSILFALSAGLALLPSEFGLIAAWPRVTDLDISYGVKNGNLDLTVSYRNNQFRGYLLGAQSGQPPYEKLPEGTRTLRDLAEITRDEFSRNGGLILPVLASYFAQRKMEIRDIRPVEIESRTAELYLDAFDGDLKFERFQTWFRTIEDVENQFRVRENSFRDVRLNAVRQAVEKIMPGFRDLRMDRLLNHLVIDKGDQTFDLAQLSDGERALIALFGDIARRLAIANPIETPLSGSGVVLIDELEQHLHPSWQRKALNLLRTTFPNLQFFVSTHSPVLASSAPPNSLYLIKDGEILHRETYGQDVALVLDEVFDTPARDEEIQMELDRLFEAIAQSSPDAVSSLEGLESRLGTNDPLLIRARVRMRGLGLL
jgi:predicted ATP-binding protein involved in virulence